MDEKYIQIFCDKKKYQLIKIIDFNKRKDTATLHAKIPNTNKNILIKIFGSNAPPKVISSFKSEIEFYKNNSSLQCISNFINSEQNFFVIELFNGDTLPKLLIHIFLLETKMIYQIFFHKLS